MGLRVSMSCSRSVPFWFGWSRKRNFPRICILRNGSLDMSFNYRLHLYNIHNSTHNTHAHTGHRERAHTKWVAICCVRFRLHRFICKSLFRFCLATSTSLWEMRRFTFFYFYYSCRTRNNKSHHIHTPHCNIYSGQIVMASVFCECACDDGRCILILKRQ